MSKFNISQKKVSDLQKKYEVKTNERELKNFLNIDDLKFQAFIINLISNTYKIYEPNIQKIGINIRGP